MPRSKKNIFGRYFVGVFVLLIIALRIYLHHPIPQYSGEKTLRGISKPVHIYTDSYGVPHVFAENEPDLFYVAGYISARDRLFQMSLVASASRGELGKFFGDKFIKEDVYLRTWGIHKIAVHIVEQIDDDTMEILERLCDGINERIDELDGKYPVEFKLLRSEPVRWKPADVIAYGRLMAHDLQQSWKPEILFGALAQYFGAEKLNELFPIYEPFRPTISEAIKYPQADLLFSTLWDLEYNIRDLTGTNGTSIGSNSWVVSGARSETGKPILANDPHLKFTQPAKWYEMHLKGGRFDVSGAFLAGFPLPVLGQNAAITWGFTNIMADDIDFFIEKTHPNDPNKYRHGENWLEMVVREEVIPRKNGGDTTIVIRETHHGPVISDVHPLLQNEQKVVSMAWTGNQITEEISTLSKIGLVNDWGGFTEVVKKFSVPGQNIVFADTAGNIGWRAAALIPIRMDGGSLLPRPGWDPAYDWQGFVPFEEMPFLYNPDQGYIATANNKIVDDDYPHYISNQWAEPSRIERIEEWLDSKEKLTIEDMKILQNDWLSPFAREVVPNIVRWLPQDLNENEIIALNILNGWDFIEDAESAAALIFHTVLDELLHNVYEDELAMIDDKAFDALVHFSMLPYRNIHWVLAEGQSSWIDDVTTPNHIETCTDIVSKSFSNAVKRIELKVGINPAIWSWGAVHTLTHPHPLGKINFLDKLFGFNVGSFKTGGSTMTVNKGEFEVLQGFDQSVGASFRRIVDLKNMNNTQFVIPTGQSGQPNSPHYDDQAVLYNAGKYRTTWFDEDFIRNNKQFRHLVLLPD
jgi:penicillin amidase